MVCFNRNQHPLEGEANILFRARTVWRDIATWINAYLISTYLSDDSEFQKEIIEKIKILPQEYGGMMKLFFGDENAQNYTTLFSNFLMLFIDFINAQKNGDVNAMNEFKKKLDENAEQRADFLSKINPFWTKSKLQNFMQDYTNTLMDQATAFSMKDYRKSIDLYNRVLYYSSAMGDYLAEGIMNYLTYSTRQSNMI